MGRRVVVALVVAIAAGTAYAEDGHWQWIAARDGIVIEGRPVEESSIHEVRATAHSRLPPGAIMATLWTHDEYVQFMPYLKRLDVLRDDGVAKLVYEQISVPLAEDRDITVRVTRAFSPETGIHEMASMAVTDEGPPASDDHVRVRTSVGRWRLAPAAAGGTAVTYTIRTDVGGWLPGWIVSRAQNDATVELVQAVLDRARQQNP